MSVEEILHQPIHLNPYTKLAFSSNNSCFYCIPSKKSQTTIVRDLCRFFQPGLISFMTFEEKIGSSNVNLKTISKLVLYLICNDWKQILRLEAPAKIILKTFCYKSKGTRNIKKFPKPSI